MTGHLLLIDASGFAHRSFHASFPSYRESDGLPTYAVLGFCGLLWRLLGAAQADPPTHAAAVFDHGGKTFRHRMFPAYKANRVRAGKAEELVAQWPLMQHAAQTMGVEPITLKGYEADDVIATMAQRAKNAGMRTTIVSSDKDMLQLVEDGAIEIVEPLQQKRVLAADVVKKFGVPPDKVTDVQALAGDAVDNIPGIKGLGLKRSAGLIRRFGSLEAILRDIHKPGCLIFVHEVRAQLRKKQVQADVRLYKRLATLRRNAPLTIDWERFVLQAPQKAHLMEFLKALEATPKYTAIFDAEPKTFRIVDDVGREAFAWWKGALAGKGGPIPQIPQCGFYKRRLVRGGPWVPARIWTDPDTDFETGKPNGKSLLLCEVAGERKDACRLWDSLYAHPISRVEFDHMVKVRDWARNHAPHEPEANPGKPIDWNKIAI